MDFTEFINSKDIADFLRNEKYVFSAMEAIWLVYQSRKKTLAEKIEAWNWIMNNMPDCEVVERINCRYRASLHEAIKEYMELLNRTIETFEKSDPSYIYRYRYLCQGDFDYCDDFEHFYTSIERFWSDFEEYSDRTTQIERVKIKRVPCDDEDILIECEFNGKREYMNISSKEIYDYDWNFFAGMWFKFPTPFKQGDIVIAYEDKKFATFHMCQGPFVLEDIVSLPEHREKIPPNGDSSDMNAWGYFLNEEGQIYDEVMWNYMDLEYYRGDFEGALRMLKAISLFLVGEIGVSLLLAAQRRIMIEALSEATELRCYTNEILDKIYLL